MCRKYIGLLVILFLAAGCQAKRPATPTPVLATPVKVQVKTRATPKPSSTTHEAEKPRPSLTQPEEPPKALVILQAQEGQKSTHIISQPKIPKDGHFSLALDMEGADLLDFLDLLFKETLKVNYAVDPSARAKVTVHIHGTFSKPEILSFTEKILEMYHLSLLEEGGLYRVVPANKLASVSGPISFALLRPRYLQVKDLVKVVQTLTTPGAKVITEGATNTLLVLDTPANVAKVSRIVGLLDEDVLADMTLALYKPKVLAADTLAGYLKDIFQATPWKERHLSNFVDFVPLKEINTLLIVARQPETLKRVYRWINELDQGELAEKEVFIYQVENGDAEEIAQILQETFSGSTLSASRSSSSTNRRTIIRAQVSGTASLSGEIRIIPDKSNNLLVIKATRQDYLTIKRLLQKIDVLPRQVVIEMLIMEITLNKELQHGVEWFLKNRITYQGDQYEAGASFSKYGISPDNLQNVNQVSLTGLTLALYRAKDLGALFNILQSVSQINILSSPVILATDNKEARIQIGQEVPIITQQVTNTSATEPNITSTVQYRDTGIILDVKPHINSSGLVKLDIVQEISSAQKNYLGLTNTPLITKRKIETSLVVKNNQTVILGGLIDNRQEFAETGVPILKDLPFLGHLFKWQKKTRDRTELLVAITPRVVRNQQEAEAVMYEFKEKIKALRQRLEGKKRAP